MSRVNRIIILLLFLLVLSRCSGPTFEGKVVELERLPYDRVEVAGREWRWAWRLPKGNHILNLGALQPESVFRLGVRDNGNKARVRLLIGEKNIKSLKTHGKESWADFEFELPSLPGSIRLEIQNSAEILISQCELSTPMVQVEPQANVLIFLIDTLRRDHLSCYGYERATSPNIDSLAGDSILFKQLMSQSSWTKPSVASLFTSNYPHVHRAEDAFDKISRDMPAIAESLKDAGYATLGVVSNPSVVPVWGFDSGFSRYVYAKESQAEDDLRNVDDAVVVDVAVDMLRMVGGKPWFLYVHTMGPHAPYQPQPLHNEWVNSAHETGTEQEKERRRSIDLYDGEIAYTDAQLGRLLEHLKSNELYDDTLIVLLSDHGEEFWEHGQGGHAKTLFEEVINVPLVIKLPNNKGAGEVRNDLVEIVDIAPTILDLLELPNESRFVGQSIANPGQSQTTENRPGYASLKMHERSMRTAKTTRAKFIWDLVSNSRGWYDLTEDPLELTPLAEPLPSAPPLASHVRDIAMKGSSGFHLLFTGKSKPGRTITGSIRGIGDARHELLYIARESESRLVENGVEFRIEMRDPHNISRWNEEIAEQENAHLRIDAAPDAQLSIEVFVDGEPVSPSDVFVGPAQTQTSLSGSTFRCSDIIADPDIFDPAALPRRFAVYAWYVPNSEQLSEDRMTPEILEALSALGYID
jgi:arylsulfatase A-like enzyme